MNILRYIILFLALGSLGGCAVHYPHPYAQERQRSAVQEAAVMEVAMPSLERIRDKTLMNTPAGAALEPGQFEQDADVVVTPEGVSGSVRYKANRKGTIK